MKFEDVIMATVKSGQAKFEAAAKVNPATEDWEQAIGRWDAETKFALAYLHLSGAKPGESLKFPLHLLELSAKDGFMLAQFVLGNCHEAGSGVASGMPRDIGKAKYWWEKAAKQGLDDARDRLAELLILQNAQEKAGKFRTCISAGAKHSVGISRGKVLAAGKNKGQCDTVSWENIIAVATGKSHTVALRSDGKVLAVGKKKQPCLDTAAMEDITAVAAGRNHTLALRADGTVSAVGANTLKQCDTSAWEGIVAITAGDDHSAGMKSDGSVVATGYDSYGQCNTGKWQDIVAVSAGRNLTVGVKNDGTVISCGYGKSCTKMTAWNNIVDVSVGGFHVVGLKADGSVVAVGYNHSRQCDVGNWQDIVAISAGYEHTIGLKSDGTVVATGNTKDNRCGLPALQLQ